MAREVKLRESRSLAPSEPNFRQTRLSSSMWNKSSVVNYLGCFLVFIIIFFPPWLQVSTNLLPSVHADTFTRMLKSICAELIEFPDKIPVVDFLDPKWAPSGEGGKGSPPTARKTSPPSARKMSTPHAQTSQEEPQVRFVLYFFLCGNAKKKIVFIFCWCGRKKEPIFFLWL